MLGIILGVLAVASWLYLLLGRGFFWLEKPLPAPPDSKRTPSAVAIVPARNESQTIARVVRGLLDQDYPGDYRVVIVDDNSTDGTGRIARETAKCPDRLAVIDAPELPAGWSGKLWAINAGIEYARREWPSAEYFLLTDADILHPRHSLTRLVALAEGPRNDGGGPGLVSLMARLQCVNPAEKLMIPAFVFFFEMLYPFRWVRDPRKATAGAAGGVMLVRREKLENAGGIAAVRGALIDDCALAANFKSRGRIWLGLAEDTVSLRAHAGMNSIWQMVARTAFTQLRHSFLILAGTVAGLTLTYLLPILLLFTGSTAAACLGACSWACMTAAYWPTVSYYRLSPLWAFTLPITAAIYAAATLDSARRYWLGRGGEWKGRAQAHTGF